MNPYPTRRSFVQMAVLPAAAILSGCAHDPQHSPPQATKRFTYQERVENVLVAPTKGKLVVLGERYHYVFDDESVGQLLAASFRHDLEGSFGTFRVTAENGIEGSYQIRIRNDDDLTGAQREEAARIGFVTAADGHLALAVSVRGIRSTAVPLAGPVPPMKLDRPYMINVDVFGDPQHRSGSAPVSNAADAVASIVVVPVFAVMFLVLGGCLTCK